MRDSETGSETAKTRIGAVADLTWDEVARRIASGAPAILPVGAASKEHGLHLPMNTDFRQAEWIAEKLAARIGALYWPALSYGYYPAFANYAGSVSLSAELFGALVAEIVTELRRFGAPHVFVLDTGISTIPVIERAVAAFGSCARGCADRTGPAVAPHMRIGSRSACPLGRACAELQRNWFDRRPDPRLVCEGQSASRGNDRGSGRNRKCRLAGALMRYLHRSLIFTMNLLMVAAPAAAQEQFLGRGMPYAAFDALPTIELPVQGGILRVGFAGGDLALPRQAVLDWIARSARAVSIYFGRFPVGETRVLIVPVEGHGVRGGQAFGYRGAAIRVRIGRGTGQRDLDRDWVMVHEMIHLALPNLDDRHNWLSEGMATYVESIARAQAGDLTAEAIWGGFVRDMPKGLPGPGDRGLDHTPTWGRTYWGGALFCLLADIEIRKRSGNRHGLQDALRGILAEGGTIELTWPIEHVNAAADRAVGLSAFSELYSQHRHQPVPVDLVALWTQLGIRTSNDVISFDADAPLARIRERISDR